jgi:hypothetical protein
MEFLAYPQGPQPLQLQQQLLQQQQALREENIKNSVPVVQIGQTRFPSIAAAVDGYPAIAPPVPVIFLESLASQWDQSMMDRYSWYDDGPRAAGETRADWVRRVTNARRWMAIIRRQEPPNMDGP